MVHVEHPADAFAEFARALRPGGYVVAYQTVATDLLAADEADWLFDVMGVVPNSAEPAVIDEPSTCSGLESWRPSTWPSEWGEWSQEQSGHAGRALLHLARLLREPDRYRAEFGRRGVRRDAGRLPVARLPDDGQARRPARRAPAAVAWITLDRTRRVRQGGPCRQH